MVKLLEVKKDYTPGFTVATASELIIGCLSWDEYDRSDSDTLDQAQRIDTTRECIGRLVEELYTTGFISRDSLARIAGVDPKNVKEAQSCEPYKK